MAQRIDCGQLTTVWVRDPTPIAEETRGGTTRRDWTPTEPWPTPAVSTAETATGGTE